MIKYSETYEIITPESAEYGEAEERGFIDESLESDFRDMVALLQGTEPSCYPPQEGCWFTACGYDMDYQTGGEESRSYHPKTDKDARYMLKAWKTGNIKRG